jgi:hypothetical protein
VNSAAISVRLGALVVTLATLVATLAMGATPATAGLGIACPDATSQPFLPWSDNAHYAFLPDGGFEAGASGWTLSGGAKVANDNEHFYLHNKSDHSSLLLPAGSGATSPPMCISLLSSKMRFVLRGATGANVRVQVLYRGLASSLLGVFDGGTVKSTGTWTPSTEIPMLGGVLPLLTTAVQFRFVTTNGNAQIDDVYLDPWKAT